MMYAAATIMRLATGKGGFDESQHSRDDSGRFSSEGGESHKDWAAKHEVHGMDIHAHMANQIRKATEAGKRSLAKRLQKVKGKLKYDTPPHALMSTLQANTSSRFFKRFKKEVQEKADRSKTDFAVGMHVARHTGHQVSQKTWDPVSKVWRGNDSQ